MQLPKGISRDELKNWKVGFELWFTKATRIAMIMARGAYWLGERRRLLTQLGTQTFEQMGNGRNDTSALEKTAEHIRKLDEKLASEEALIQELRASTAAKGGENG